jgi:type I restriction enzyme S subunit
MTALFTIPASWAWTTLGEIAEVVGGVTKDTKKQSDPNLPEVPYLRVANVQRGYLDLREITKIRVPESTLTKLRLQPGDVLLNEGGDRDKLGRGWVWSGQIPDCIHQNHVFRARLPEETVLPRFLAWYINDPARQWFDQHAAQSVNLASISLSTIKQLPVPLPPLDEQNRIVATLDDHLSRLDAARYELDKTVSRSARLHADIRETLLNPWSTEVTQLGLILREPLANGRSVRTNPGGFPVLRLTALRDGYLDLDERKDGEWTLEDAKPFLVRKHDFFIGRGNGSLSRVGRGALLATEPDLVAFPDTLIRARVNELHVLPDFLRFIWDSRGIRRQIESAARTTAGIYKINQQIIEQIRVPIPPLQDQERIIEEFDAITSRMLHARDAVESSATRAGKLRTSLLAEAFSGRLVTQDPADEPASMLLDRIRARRAEQPRTGRGRSKAKLSRQKEILL